MVFRGLLTFISSDDFDSLHEARATEIRASWVQPDRKATHRGVSLYKHECTRSLTSAWRRETVKNERAKLDSLLSVSVARSVMRAMRS